MAWGSDLCSSELGALRNGEPFQDWDLPPALHRLRRRLGTGDEGDRRFVRVLSAVLTDALEPVEAAVREAPANGTASDELILNILPRRREPATPHTTLTSEDRMLQHPPLADSARSDLPHGYDAAAGTKPPNPRHRPHAHSGGA